MAEKENEKDIVSEIDKKLEGDTKPVMKELTEEKAGEEKSEDSVLSTKTEEENNVENDAEEQLSSLDILWSHAFGELDQWGKHANHRDEVFLKEAKYFAESVQRNQDNIKEIVDQFNKEFAEWERIARDEFLMSTTSLQHFFPIKSYEDINSEIDHIQKKTMAILTTPCQALTKNLTLEKYLEVVEQYITLRRKVRMQYISAVKQAGNLIYENQKGFVNFFARQIKALMFPLNKYIEKTEEYIKS